MSVTSTSSRAVRVAFSAHAIDRLGQRVYPGLQRPAVRASANLLSAHGAIGPDAPAWAGPVSAADAWLIAGDVAFALRWDAGEGRMVAVTCIARGGRCTPGDRRCRARARRARARALELDRRHDLRCGHGR